ncbi:MAG TPA: UDP-N-acetylmuramoyl-L-alanyl-D-glutamate--2,6-diaminopimelate ligase, partial [Salinisphaeraceae bacterium]|nr:UDP-N-acetylmuramoyl-L-alanyl-D-glutamate--2,6-diaminopimelate ligase [Salinisphaeraceae bacterium]
DMLWLTDDNPRGEAPQAIIDDMLAGLEATTADYVVEHDRVRAIHSAVQAAEPGDAVLIAGKGHEAWQQIGAQRRAHDDRIVARQALEAA